MSSVSVHIIPEAALGLPWSKKDLYLALTVLLEAVGLEQAELELLVVTDEIVQKQNFLAMKCQGPTNILSFPTTTDPVKKTAQLGSLMLSVDTLRREAFLYAQPLSAYTIRLLVHGFAHLLGHEHGPGMDSFCQQLETMLENAKLLTDIPTRSYCYD